MLGFSKWFHEQINCREQYGNQLEFNYENYEQTYSWQGINNGHTIKFTPVGDQLP